MRDASYFHRFRKYARKKRSASSKIAGRGITKGTPQFTNWMRLTQLYWNYSMKVRQEGRRAG